MNVLVIVQDVNQEIVQTARVKAATVITVIVNKRTSGVYDHY